MVQIEQQLILFNVPDTRSTFSMGTPLADVSSLRS
jgi:hypothetical protein